MTWDLNIKTLGFDKTQSKQKGKWKQKLTSNSEKLNGISKKVRGNRACKSEFTLFIYG
jgi:hypothetical protein